MIAQPAGRHFTRKATAWLAATLLICALCSQATAAPQPADAPPAYAPGTSPTSLGKTLTVRSNHTVASAVLKDAVVQRRVSVTNCSDVRVTQPRHSISMTGDANTHMVLNDTDALDVADDEALDLVATGNAKVVAGEMDGLASVFPDGSITSVAGQAADGSTRSSDAPTPVTPPSRLTNDVDVSASFKVPSRIGSSVRIIDETTLQGASAVHIEGASVDVKSGTSRNAQIVANDADLADVADNGGTTGMATGNALVVTGEVEEPASGASSHGPAPGARQLLARRMLRIPGSSSVTKPSL